MTVEDFITSYNKGLVPDITGNNILTEKEVLLDGIVLTNTVYELVEGIVLHLNHKDGVVTQLTIFIDTLPYFTDAEATLIHGYRTMHSIENMFDTTLPSHLATVAKNQYRAIIQSLSRATSQERERRLRYGGNEYLFRGSLGKILVTATLKSENN